MEGSKWDAVLRMRGHFWGGENTDPQQWNALTVVQVPCADDRAENESRTRKTEEGNGGDLCVDKIMSFLPTDQGMKGHSIHAPKKEGTLKLDFSPTFFVHHVLHPHSHFVATHGRCR